MAALCVAELVRVLAVTGDNGQTSHEACFGPVNNPGEVLLSDLPTLFPFSPRHKRMEQRQAIPSIEASRMVDMVASHPGVSAAMAVTLAAFMGLAAAAGIVGYLNRR